MINDSITIILTIIITMIDITITVVITIVKYTTYHFSDLPAAWVEELSCRHGYGSNAP